jgi:lipid-A-disaccharide synthase
MGSPSIFVFAGEVSADLYGKELIAHLRNVYPQARIWGVGGPAMRKEGVELLLPMEQFRAMGFSGVLKALPRIVKNFFIIKRAILKKKPELLLFIDQPTLTMRLAKSLRRAKFCGKIVQFVAPSVWAWKSHRAEAMAKDFDLLLTLFDFEPKYFAHTSLKTVFVGHPMIEIIESTPSCQRLESFGLDPSQPIVTIFPGSRPSEIEKNLPPQLKAAELLCQAHPEIQIALCTTEAIDRRAFEQQRSIRFVPFAARYALMKQTTVALAKSGTVTLELAIHAVPTVVTYSLSFLNRFIAMYIYKLQLPFYCIVNILSQKELFTELIRPPVSPSDIAARLKEWYENEEKRIACQKECLALKNSLKTNKTASLRAVEEICDIL